MKRNKSRKKGKISQKKTVRKAKNIYIYKRALDSQESIRVFQRASRGLSQCVSLSESCTVLEEKENQRKRKVGVLQSRYSLSRWWVQVPRRPSESEKMRHRMTRAQGTFLVLLHIFLHLLYPPTPHLNFTYISLLVELQVIGISSIFHEKDTVRLSCRNSSFILVKLVYYYVSNSAPYRCKTRQVFSK